ncbi:DUF4189 domain-containing protein [Nocardia sp. NPDC052566]|uniref:DUF4189 domain-containing protein n=1 Tax=Nocardia sp. NPDC052566 TaxID=3364330 RepID=UPI0037CAE075
MTYPPQEPYDPRIPPDPYAGQQYQQNPYQTNPYPGTPYPSNPMPGYGPEGPRRSGGPGLIIALVVSAVLVIGAGGVGLAFLINQSKPDTTDVLGGNTPTSTTRPLPTSFSLPPLPTFTTRPAPPPPPPSNDIWIAAIYNPATKNVYWARSSISSADASSRARAECGNCQEPTWARNGCVAFVIGKNGWAGSWGATVAEAEGKAINTVETKYGGSGPYNRWNKCSRE